MSTLHLLDPEVRPALDAFPDIDITRETLPMLREAAEAMTVLVDAEAVGAQREEIEIPGLADDQPAVRALKYTPVDAPATMGGYLHIHGGGYILGAPEMADAHNAGLAAALGATIISVDYRLAPEHPVPAALDDCYAALAWCHQNAEKLGIDPARIAVGGESAGGGLAASLVLYAYERREFPICFQSLTYPMLDDRTGGADAPGDPLTGEFIWTRERNLLGWSCYFGDATPQAPYAPARAARLEGLPPAWISTATLDLFRDEDIAYAQRLMAAGVATELIVYPGACHGFQMAAEAQVTQQYFKDHLEALRRGLSPRGD